MNKRAAYLPVAFFIGWASLLGVALPGCSTGLSANERSTQVEQSSGPLSNASPVQAKKSAGLPLKASPAGQDSLSRLQEGNRRFVSGQMLHPRQDKNRRSELAAGQHPFCIVLSCADSRTPPELLFDQGLGDLFVIRVAGNVVNEDGLGSIEYAVEHLHSALLVVMGHESCGAIKAAREIISTHATAPGHLGPLIESLRSVVEATSKQNVEATCKANVVHVVEALRSSEPIMAPHVRDGSLAVIGAYYSLENGVVTFLNRDEAEPAGQQK